MKNESRKKSVEDNQVLIYFAIAVVASIALMYEHFAYQDRVLDELCGKDRSACIREEVFTCSPFTSQVLCYESSRFITPTPHGE